MFCKVVFLDVFMSFSLLALCFKTRSVLVRFGFPKLNKAHLPERSMSGMCYFFSSSSFFLCCFLLMLDIESLLLLGIGSLMLVVCLSMFLGANHLLAFSVATWAYDLPMFTLWQKETFLSEVNQNQDPPNERCCENRAFNIVVVAKMGVLLMIYLPLFFSRFQL